MKTPEVIALEIVGRWGYEEPYWWMPIAEAIQSERDRGAYNAQFEKYYKDISEKLVAERDKLKLANATLAAENEALKKRAEKLERMRHERG